MVWMLGVALAVLSTTAEPSAPPSSAPEQVVAPTRWEDADRLARQAGQGSIQVCTSVGWPLQLIPYVGTLALVAVEWACLGPAVLAVDYVQRFHGTRQSTVWESFTALALSKLFRDATRWPAVIGLTASGLGLLGAGVLTVSALGASLWPLAWLAALPVAAGGLITASSLALLILQVIRDPGAELVFEWAYTVLAQPFPSEEAQRAEQLEAIPRPPFNVFERTFALAAAAAGTRPSFRMIYLVPVVGPIFRAGDKVQELRRVLRKIAAEDLQEGPRRYWLMDGALITLGGLQAVMDVAAQLSVALGAAVIVAGFAAALPQLQEPHLAPASLALTAVTGVLGTAVASLGLLLLLVRDVPDQLLPLAVPVAYGLWPERGFFPDRNGAAPVEAVPSPGAAGPDVSRRVPAAPSGP